MAVNSNTDLSDRAINRAAMIRLFEGRSNKKIDTILGAHGIRTDTIIKSSKNFTDFEKKFKIELTKTYREAFNTSKRSMLDLVADQTLELIPAYKVHTVLVRGVFKSKTSLLQAIDYAIKDDYSNITNIKIDFDGITIKRFHTKD